MSNRDAVFVLPNTQGGTREIVRPSRRFSVVDGDAAPVHNVARAGGEAAHEDPIECPICLGPIDWHQVDDPAVSLSCGGEHILHKCLGQQF